MNAVKVAVLGGGVAGLSVAHELAERSGKGVDYEIHIYEKRNDFVGGKARSTPVLTRAGDGVGPVGSARVGEPQTTWNVDGTHALPGEHGFRFFPGFYKHLPDTMARIPLHNGNTVFDNLVVAKSLLLSRFGKKGFVMPTGVPRSLDDFLADVRELFNDRHADLGLTAYQLETFARKLWRILTSCDDRRLKELEPQTWWKYLGVGDPGLGGAYESFLAEGLSRSLLANNPRVASARTVGNTNIQLIFDVLSIDKEADRLLNGPTSIAWLTPWREFLTNHPNGSVHLHTGCEVKQLSMAGGNIVGALIETNGTTQDLTADIYVGALPVERMAELLSSSPDVVSSDPSLRNIINLQDSVGRMYGLQFYLTRDVPIVDGHALYVDSPWALVSISEVQFWNKTIDIEKCDDGKSKGLISVCISEWTVAGIDGAPAAQDSPSREALVKQVWDQLKKALNEGGHELLKDEDLHAWYVDEDVDFLKNKNNEPGREPLFINQSNDWFKRPTASTAISNFFLASDYVQTFTDVACMEAANEAARRAVNGILALSKSTAAPCELWPLQEPALFKPYKQADQLRFNKGLPWIGSDDPQISPYPAPTANYIKRSAEVCHLQPFAGRNIAMFGWFMKGDQAKLQQHVDTHLNQPSGGAVDYRVLSDMVMITFADMRIGTSTELPDADEGYIPELSVTFWVPTALAEHGELTRLAMHVPFIVVDNAWSMAAGREIYGFPKEIGTFELPTDPKTATQFKASSIVIKDFSAQSKAELKPLISMSKHKQSWLSGLWHDLTDIKDGIEELSKLAGDGIGKEFIENLISNALDQNVPSVFLKQFRDITDGNKACYQAVVEANVRTTAVKEVGFLHGDWTCDIIPYDSHPIRETLGLPASGPIPTVLPFHVEMDFIAENGHEVWRANGPKAEPKKIAILGGGVGAMTAAYQLTEEENWQQLYEITIYQMGWRIGGKGASGRNMEKDARIEEHGLHLWFGYYARAFNLMRRAYEANDRPTGAPLATVEEAFKPHGQISIAETDGRQWNIWRQDLPLVADDFPGGDEPLAMIKILENLLGTLLHVFQDMMPEPLRKHELATHKHSIHEYAMEWIGERYLHADTDSLHPDARSIAIAHALLKRHADGAPHESWIDKLVAFLDVEAGHILKMLLQFALKTIDAVFTPWISMLSSLLQDIEKLEKDLGIPHWEVRRFAALLEIGQVNLRGIIEDDIIFKGIDHINDIEYRAWLKKHGGTELSIDSDLIRTAYESIFAFEEGDTNRPNLAAGTTVWGLMHLCFAWKGAVMYKMQAGMGDTVFTPLYEVLKKRGVKFKFFHKVENLGLDAHKTHIDTIRVAEQVKVKNGADYNPLVDVKGLPCWPSTPLFDQLVNGDSLKSSGENLESHWCQQQPVSRTTLRKGVDFDEVVLGISIGALPIIANELIEANTVWQKMIAGVPTIQTQAFQMWMTEDLPALGWPVAPGSGSHPVWDSARTPLLGGYVQPQNTWCDMSHLIPREEWNNQTPGSCAYFCGPMAAGDIPPVTDTHYPQEQTAMVKGYALQWVRDNLSYVWPNALRTGGVPQASADLHDGVSDGVNGGFKEGFNWNLTMDPAEQKGTRRFDAQFWRANVDPTERYALSPAGGVTNRLPSGDSGFQNLYLAGDWTKNDFSIGCVEAAASSGLDAAAALLTKVKAGR